MTCVSRGTEPWRRRGSEVTLLLTHGCNRPAVYRQARCRLPAIVATQAVCFVCRWSLSTRTSRCTGRAPHAFPTSAAVLSCMHAVAHAATEPAIRRIWFEGGGALACDTSRRPVVCERSAAASHSTHIIPITAMGQRESREGGHHAHARATTHHTLIAAPLAYCTRLSTPMYRQPGHTCDRLAPPCRPCILGHAA